MNMVRIGLISILFTIVLQTLVDAKECKKDTKVCEQFEKGCEVKASQRGDLCVQVCTCPLEEGGGPIEYHVPDKTDTCKKCKNKGDNCKTYYEVEDSGKCKEVCKCSEKKNSKESKSPAVGRSLKKKKTKLSARGITKKSKAVKPSSSEKTSKKQQPRGNMVRARGIASRDRFGHYIEEAPLDEEPELSPRYANFVKRVPSVRRPPVEDYDLGYGG